MREVEAEVVGGHQAALLGHMRAEPVAKCGVQQVGRTVIGANSISAIAVDLLLHRIAYRKLPRDDLRQERVKFS